MHKYTPVINSAVEFLVKHSGTPKILLKISKNLGDTLHGKPILKHYRLLYPDAAIAFVISQPYHGVHEHGSYFSQGGLFLLPAGITEQERLKLWDVIHGFPQIDIKLIPAINPFQVLHPENRWSHPTLADQYFANAGIVDCKPLGGRRYVISVTEDDKAWANDFMIRNKLTPEQCVAFEYNSYSHPAPWNAQTWTKFFSLSPGMKFLGFAGAHETLIPGMVDGRDITYRRTVALLNIIQRMITIGSGVGMLAMGAEKQPKIYEIGISESVTGKNCGYCDSEVISNPTPESVKQRMGI